MGELNPETLNMPMFRMLLFPQPRLGAPLGSSLEGALYESSRQRDRCFNHEQCFCVSTHTSDYSDQHDLLENVTVKYMQVRQ